MAPLLLAASVTPLRDGGARVDEAAIEPLARFLVDHGVDGLFALGTTGDPVAEWPGASSIRERRARGYAMGTVS